MLCVPQVQQLGRKLTGTTCSLDQGIVVTTSPSPVRVRGGRPASGGSGKAARLSYRVRGEWMVLPGAGAAGVWPDASPDSVYHYVRTSGPLVVEWHIIHAVVIVSVEGLPPVLRSTQVCAYVTVFFSLSPPQKLPAARSASDRAAMEALADQWHMDHYSVEADIDTRDSDPTIQHLSFLYGVRVTA